MHIVCHYNESNNHIYSLANIYDNKYFKCLEFFSLHQKVKFGINILKHHKKYNSKKNFFFDENIINYNSFNNNNDYEFDPIIINKLYLSLIDDIKYNKKKRNSLKLIQSYIKYPNFCFKKNVNITINCSYESINQNCKYYFYLNIINISKNLYKKDDYLFCDFIYASRSSDDTYPIFKEMLKLNLSVHYLTAKRSIYKEYCQNNKKCLSIILVKKEEYRINGNFLEKYLTLFLKLKAAIAGATFLVIDNLFYNIDYITFISVGHGVAFFKNYLYSEKSYYGYKRYNKILLPPSEKIISVAKKKGWKDINIVKINLPIDGINMQK